MSRKILLILMALALGLAACQSATPVTETAAPVTEAPAAGTPEKVATATEAQPSATAEGSATEVVDVEPIASGPATCTVVSTLPTPSPAEVSKFPAVGADDWVEGPEDAYVTIIEYGDFQ